ncbi:N-ATPase subunit AtpR [Paraburkholderia ferrariae]|jgi:F1F0 ATPase subunit 2|uniref:N-ATPase subunit AtpR n=1 Tax=Paraburkholderia ferrariae TaxID=386056 RepID=UPI0004814EB1|nr:ATP synthase subunit I [Paraburkholderia ferrariae]
MTSHWTFWALAAGLAAGFAAGAAHFAALRWNTRLFVAGRFGYAFGALAARCVLTALLLLVLARTGAPALLAGMAGLLLARHATLRAVAAVRS